MSIKYEIMQIKNSQGTGEERHYIKVIGNEPLTGDQLKQNIQDSSTLKKGDIEAALSELRENMVRELSAGNRFHLPSIGYFSLSVGLHKANGKAIEKVRGDDLLLRNIRFRPEAAVMRDVDCRLKFERSSFSSKSQSYSAEILLEKIKAYLSKNVCINRRMMEREFGLRRWKALRWLKYFCAMGVLVKDGASNAPVYFLKN